MMKFDRRDLSILIATIYLIVQNLNSCSALNDEGLALCRFRERVVSDPFGALSNWNDDIGAIDPCSWFGVECSNGNVVSLNLKDLRLVGTLAPDVGRLVHIKSIILRNNSFSGNVPEEIGELNGLEVLDLGYNNFSGLLPSELRNGLSLFAVLLDNNELFGSLSSDLQMPPRDISQTRDIGPRSLKEATSPVIRPRSHKNHLSPQFSPPSSPAVDSPSLSPSPSPLPSPLPTVDSAPPSPSSESPSSTPKVSTLFSHSSALPSQPKHHKILKISAAIGGPFFVLFLCIGLFVSRSSKVAAVRPWATGISGQLRKAFVTGVPKLKRVDLEKACEDFSNVIGCSSMGTVYKGTLSNGVEIAVISVATSAKDWSNNLETRFRKKIDKLSKVNHKNFVNLIGYCKEDKPLTRMMVFEYAPNGTLFEHLHMKEAEHLDWGMRMRIVMGIAYYLNHIHHLSPPISHTNLNSSSVLLTEDNAAKVSDFHFLSDSDTNSNPINNVYSFGLILYEIVTGKIPPYSNHECALDDVVDRRLESFEEEEIEGITEVIGMCVAADPELRPSMGKVCTRLREITGVGADGAVPRLSPLWWAELEILTTTEAD